MLIWRSPLFHSVTKDVEKKKAFLNKFNILGLLSLGKAVEEHSKEGTRKEQLDVRGFGSCGGVFCPKNTRKKELEKNGWMRGNLDEKDEQSGREVAESAKKKEKSLQSAFTKAARFLSEEHSKEGTGKEQLDARGEKDEKSGREVGESAKKEEKS
ncbi:hypothetical protein CEXT_692601 [Caerostris extrusa]|uniref:Uncharacterized protein n=1 Tax=Caerostris extrusa TaxID=172846 RepID=A0AAV4SJV5_CAEEX|nr:hypothetical protein CEXT_692601 [Caerostris extrusa]